LNTNLRGTAPAKRAAPAARGNVLAQIATVQEAAIRFGCWVVQNKPPVPEPEKLEILREAVDDITRWMDTGDIFEREEAA
jgi:aryl-alcohol dehydrogenase-like predicted oxidoreductase